MEIEKTMEGTTILKEERHQKWNEEEIKKRE